MPRKSTDNLSAGGVPLKDALEKKGKGGLTLAQLASYDDLITDGMVDHVGLRRTLSTCASR